MPDPQVSLMRNTVPTAYAAVPIAVTARSGHVAGITGHVGPKYSMRMSAVSSEAARGAAGGVGCMVVLDCAAGALRGLRNGAGVAIGGAALKRLAANAGSHRA